MKKTLAWYKRFVQPEWKKELKLREENNRIILYKIEKYYENNKLTKIDFGEVDPENMTKAIIAFKNNI